MEFLKTGSASVKVLQAGPTLDLDGNMNGSMVVMESDDISDVYDFLDSDPYKAVDLFESIEVRSWNWAIGAP